MDRSTAENGEELTILSREELTERVRQRTADLQKVMDTMADVLLRLGPSGRVRMVNAAATDVLGYDEDELIGKPIDHLLAPDRSDDQLSSMVTSGEFVEALLREHQLTNVESYLETAGGEEIPMSLSASVMHDGDGAVDGIVCVATPISERKRAEDRAAFLHSVLRHDLGNKLLVTDGYLELLADVDLDEPRDGHLEHARNGVKEAISLIEDVRTLDRLDDERSHRAVSLATILRESVDRHADLADREGFTVEVSVDSTLTVGGGPLLKELFANLVENALAHSNGTHVELTANPGAETVTVRVADDGDGIAVDPPERVLDRGTTAADDGGSGLGTYLATRIAETYGGSVDLAETDLGGACFAVTLPRVD